MILVYVTLEISWLNRLQPSDLLQFIPNIVVNTLNELECSNKKISQTDVDISINPLTWVNKDALIDIKCDFDCTLSLLPLLSQNFSNLFHELLKDSEMRRTFNGKIYLQTPKSIDCREFAASKHCRANRSINLTI